MAPTEHQAHAEPGPVPVAAAQKTRRPAPDHRHSQPSLVLHRLFGSQLQTLKACLLHLTTHAPETQASLRNSLEQPGDSPAYIQLVQQTLVVMSDKAPAMSDLVTLQQNLSQTEVVLRAVDVLVRTGHENNMLRHGYRTKRPGRSAFNPYLQHAAAWAPSTAGAGLLQSCPSWGLLLSRVGDALLLHLLLHASIFVPLGQCNYLQVAGKSVVEEARQNNQAAVQAAPQQHTGQQGNVCPAAAVHQAGVDADPAALDAVAPQAAIRKGTGQSTGGSAPARAALKARKTARGRMQYHRAAAAAVGTQQGSQARKRPAALLGVAHGKVTKPAGQRPKMAHVSRLIEGKDVHGECAVDACTDQQEAQPNQEGTQTVRLSSTQQSTEQQQYYVKQQTRLQGHGRPSSWQRRRAAQQAKAAKQSPGLQPPGNEQPAADIEHLPCNHSSNVREAGPVAGAQVPAQCTTPQRALHGSCDDLSLILTQAEPPMSPLPLWDFTGCAVGSPAAAAAAVTTSAGEHLLPTQHEPPVAGTPAIAHVLPQGTAPPEVRLEGGGAWAGPDVPLIIAQATEDPRAAAAGKQSGGQPEHASTKHGRLPEQQVRSKTRRRAAGRTAGRASAAGTADDNMGASDAGVHGPAGGLLHGAASRTLPRSVILYSSSFHSRPGLPSRHLLQSLPATSEGAKKLLLSIFCPPSSTNVNTGTSSTLPAATARTSGTTSLATVNRASAGAMLGSGNIPPSGGSSAALAGRPCPTPAAGSGGACAPTTLAATATTAKPLPAGQHPAGAAAATASVQVPQQQGLRLPLTHGIPRRLRRLLPVMLQMLRRARKCPFHLLLSRHCPMPNSRPSAATNTSAQSGPCSRPMGTARTHAVRRPLQQQQQQLLSPAVQGLTAGQRAACLTSNTATPRPPGDHSQHRPGLLNISQVACLSNINMCEASQAVLDGSLPVGVAEQLDLAEEEQAVVPVGGSTGRAANSRGLLAASCSHAAVSSFTWSVLCHIIPAALLGDNHNRGLLLQRVHQVVALGRFENITLHNLMAGQTTSGHAWLYPTAAHQLTRMHTAAQATEHTSNGRGAAHSSSSKGAVQKRSHVGMKWKAFLQQQRGKAGLHGRKITHAGHAAAQATLSCWICWLFAELVLPILRTHFFITETEPYKQRMFYYRKPVWARLQSTALKELLQERFKPLKCQQAYEQLCQRELGMAKLRLVPKMWGMRPIVNMGSRTSATFRLKPGPGQVRAQTVRLTFKSVNNVLQNVHQALKAEVSARPSLVGGSVWGYEDILRALYPYIHNFRTAAQANPGLKVHIVSADVARAFDSLQLPRLLSLMDGLMSQEHYHVIRYNELTPAMNTSLVRIRHQRAAHLGPSQTFPGLATWLQSTAAQGLGSYNTLFTDQVPHVSLPVGDMRALLGQAVNHNIVLVGGKWYQQTCGIPQGAIISTLLCSLYLADMETACIRPVLPGTDAWSTSARPQPVRPAPWQGRHQQQAHVRKPSAAWQQQQRHDKGQQQQQEGMQQVVGRKRQHDASAAVSLMLLAPVEGHQGLGVTGDRAAEADSAAGDELGACKRPRLAHPVGILAPATVTGAASTAAAAATVVAVTPGYEQQQHLRLRHHASTQHVYPHHQQQQHPHQQMQLQGGHAPTGNQHPHHETHLHLQWLGPTLSPARDQQAAGSGGHTNSRTPSTWPGLTDLADAAQTGNSMDATTGSDPLGPREHAVGRSAGGAAEQGIPLQHIYQGAAAPCIANPYAGAPGQDEAARGEKHLVADAGGDQLGDQLAACIQPNSVHVGAALRPAESLLPYGQATQARLSQPSADAVERSITQAERAHQPQQVMGSSPAGDAVHGKYSCLMAPPLPHTQPSPLCAPVDPPHASPVSPRHVTPPEAGQGNSSPAMCLSAPAPGSVGAQGCAMAHGSGKAHAGAGQCLLQLNVLVGSANSPVFLTLGLGTASTPGDEHQPNAGSGSGHSVRSGDAMSEDQLLSPHYTPAQRYIPSTEPQFEQDMDVDVAATEPMDMDQEHQYPVPATQQQQQQVQPGHHEQLEQQYQQQVWLGSEGQQQQQRQQGAFTGSEEQQPGQPWWQHQQLQLNVQASLAPTAPDLLTRQAAGRRPLQPEQNIQAHPAAVLPTQLLVPVALQQAELQPTQAVPSPPRAQCHTAAQGQTAVQPMLEAARQQDAPQALQSEAAEPSSDAVRPRTLASIQAQPNSGGISKEGHINEKSTGSGEHLPGGTLGGQLAINTAQMHMGPPALPPAAVSNQEVDAGVPFSEEPVPSLGMHLASSTFGHMLGAAANTQQTPCREAHTGVLGIRGAAGNQAWYSAGFTTGGVSWIQLAQKPPEFTPHTSITPLGAGVTAPRPSRGMNLPGQLEMQLDAVAQSQPSPVAVFNMGSDRHIPPDVGEGSKQQGHHRATMLQTVSRLDASMCAQDAGLEGRQGDDRQSVCSTGPLADGSTSERLEGPGANLAGGSDISNKPATAAEPLVPAHVLPGHDTATPRKIRARSAAVQPMSGAGDHGTDLQAWLDAAGSAPPSLQATQQDQATSAPPALPAVALHLLTRASSGCVLSPMPTLAATAAVPQDRMRNLEAAAQVASDPQQCQPGVQVLQEQNGVNQHAEPGIQCTPLLTSSSHSSDPFRLPLLSLPIQPANLPVQHGHLTAAAAITANVKGTQDIGMGVGNCVQGIGIEGPTPELLQPVQTALQHVTSRPAVRHLDAAASNQHRVQQAIEEEYNGGRANTGHYKQQAMHEGQEAMYEGQMIGIASQGREGQQARQEEQTDHVAAVQVVPLTQVVVLLPHAVPQQPHPHTQQPLALTQAVPANQAVPVSDPPTLLPIESMPPAATGMMPGAAVVAAACVQEDVRPNHIPLTQAVATCPAALTGVRDSAFPICLPTQPDMPPVHPTHTTAEHVGLQVQPMSTSQPPHAGVAAPITDQVWLPTQPIPVVPGENVGQLPTHPVSPGNQVCGHQAQVALQAQSPTPPLQALPDDPRAALISMQDRQQLDMTHRHITGAPCEWPLPEQQQHHQEQPCRALPASLLGKRKAADPQQLHSAAENAEDSVHASSHKERQAEAVAVRQQGMEVRSPDTHTAGAEVAQFTRPTLRTSAVRFVPPATGCSPAVLQQQHTQQHRMQVSAGASGCSLLAGHAVEPRVQSPLAAAGGPTTGACQQQHGSRAWLSSRQQRLKQKAAKQQHQPQQQPQQQPDAQARSQQDATVQAAALSCHHWLAHKRVRRSNALPPEHGTTHPQEHGIYPGVRAAGHQGNAASTAPDMPAPGPQTSAPWPSAARPSRNGAFTVARVVPQSHALSIMAVEHNRKRAREVAPDSPRHEAVDTVMADACQEPNRPAHNTEGVVDMTVAPTRAGPSLLRLGELPRDEDRVNTTAHADQQQHQQEAAPATTACDDNCRGYIDLNGAAATMAHHGDGEGHMDLSGAVAAGLVAGGLAAALPASLLLRLVDDFLLLTTSRSAAQAAVLRLLQGFPEYGCAVNPLKTQLNFTLSQPLSPPSSNSTAAGHGQQGAAAGLLTSAAGIQVQDAAQQEAPHQPQQPSEQGSGQQAGLNQRVWISPCGQSFIRWCGLLLNARSLELQADYTRYRGVHLMDTITLPCGPHPARQLPMRVASYMRPKCHALLLDATINSRPTVCLNLYQAFLLAAMKMHCYLRTLTSRNPRQQAGPLLPAANTHSSIAATAGSNNPQLGARHAALVLRSITATITYTCRLVRNRVAAAASRHNLPLRCEVSVQHVRWLGLQAFLRVLTRKQANYRLVLQELQQQLQSPKFQGASRCLAAVLDPDKSAVFDQILF